MGHNSPAPNMERDHPPEVVVPSSMRFYTPLPHRLAETNPPLFAQVVSILNHIDRSRNILYRQVIGDLKVRHG